MTLRSALTCLILPATLALSACDGDKKADAAPPPTDPRSDASAEANTDPGSKGAAAGAETPEANKDDEAVLAKAEPPAGALMADAPDEAPAEASNQPVDPPGAPEAADGVHVFEKIESRQESLIPSDTPQDRKDDYLKLPVKRGDGKPVGAIGPDGTHLDDFVIGRGFTKGRCDEAADTFYTDGEDDRVNVCLRIVHKPVEEKVTVKWIKDGRPPRKTEVNVKAIHAYRTRAWLPIKGNRRGEWEAVIEASDGTELARGRFTVK